MCAASQCAASKPAAVGDAAAISAAILGRAPCLTDVSSWCSDQPRHVCLAARQVAEVPTPSASSAESMLSPGMSAAPDGAPPSHWTSPVK